VRHIVNFQHFHSSQFYTAYQLINRIILKDYGNIIILSIPLLSLFIKCYYYRIFFHTPLPYFPLIIRHSFLSNPTLPKSSQKKNTASSKMGMP